MVECIDEVEVADDLQSVRTIGLCRRIPLTRQRGSSVLTCIAACPNICFHPNRDEHCCQVRLRAHTVLASRALLLGRSEPRLLQSEKHPLRRCPCRSKAPADPFCSIEQL